MARAYSMDWRQPVVDAIESGLSSRKAARPILWAGRIKSIPHLDGLHHSYVRM